MLYANATPLEASIHKWWERWESAKSYRGRTVMEWERDCIDGWGCHFCPLCEAYRAKNTDAVDCERCPLVIKGGGKSACCGTPFQKVVEMKCDVDVVTDDLIDAIEEELLFLIRCL